MRTTTIKIVIITSLFWIMLHILIFQIIYPGCENSKFSIDTQELTNQVVSFKREAINTFQTITHSSYGHLGSAVVVPEDQQANATKMFELHQFNLVASDLIGINRTLSDYRHFSCLSVPYPSLTELSKLATSVIIVFHNEAWTTLLRTVNSVFTYTPAQLIHEIILVDDASDMEHLGSPLDDYVAGLSKSVKIVRMMDRQGLIVARLKGAKMATGKTITFLDAHCECTVGWLEPMLAEIHRNRKVVVSPVIDIINEQNFKYSAVNGERTWGGFDWSLSFHWEHTSRTQDKRIGNGHNSPVKTPAMAGGLFTIDRDYFYEIGSYDDGMEIWGGENVEMSIRIWTCGGEILIHPCSRVGHVYRSKSPYSWPGGVSHIISKNTLRTVNVWLDEYKVFYNKAHPLNNQDAEMGDISARVELRKSLQCKPFKWFLQEVYPESNFPLDFTYFGPVKSIKNHLCLDSMGKGVGELVGVSRCHDAGGNQVAAYSADTGQIRFAHGCLDSNRANRLIKFETCAKERSSRQNFVYDTTSKSLRHEDSQLCLNAVTGISSSQLRLEKCSSASSQWDFDKLQSK